MANYMAEVAKMLGVELDEEFDIVFPLSPSCKATVVFKENGLKIINTNVVKLIPYWDYSILNGLLIGDYTIKHKSWKPKVDERFYIVTVDGSVMCKYWDDCSTYINYYRLGNFYRTYAEAEANRDKWVEFYASDEVLEV